MRAFALSLIAGASLSACASAPPANPWDDVDVSEEIASTPPDCGSFPMPSAIEDDRITYDEAGVNALDAYRTCAETNQIVAAERTAEVNQHRVAEASLVEAGQHQRRIAELQRELLEDERRARFWERTQYWFMIVVLGAASL